MKFDIDKKWLAEKIDAEDGCEVGAGMDAIEAFKKDWRRKCEVCGAKPVVNATGLCGPCTFGEAETAGGNW